MSTHTRLPAKRPKLTASRGQLQIVGTGETKQARACHPGQYLLKFTCADSDQILVSEHHTGQLKQLRMVATTSNGAVNAIQLAGTESLTDVNALVVGGLPDPCEDVRLAVQPPAGRARR